MQIDKSKTKLIFSFTADEWFLCKSNEDETGYPYSLNYRIDRSEKGKIDDVGMVKIYLDEQEAKQARENGFSEIINNLD